MYFHAVKNSFNYHHIHLHRCIAYLRELTLPNLYYITSAGYIPKPPCRNTYPPVFPL